MDLSSLAIGQKTSLSLPFSGSLTQTGWLSAGVLVGSRTPAATPTVGRQLLDPEYTPVQELLYQLSVTKG